MNINLFNLNKFSEFGLKSPLSKIIARERDRIIERKTIYMLSIILPIFLFTLLAMIYKNGVIHDLPVAVYDEDHSSISRSLSLAMDATSSMQITKYVNSIEELKAAFRKGEIQGAFYFPRDLEKNLLKNRQSTIIVYKNTANLIYGNMILRDGMTVARSASGSALLQKLKRQGMEENPAMNIVNPIRVEAVSLYNPQYNYERYLVPGLIPSMLQMIIMVCGVLLISSEFTHGTFPALMKEANYNPFNILVGKALPHIGIHSASMLGMLGIIFPLFHIEIGCSTIVLCCFFLLFILACLFPALLVSSILKDQMMATETAVFICTPAFIFSGYTFPLWGMPDVHNYFAQIIPFTHFFTGFVKIFYMNAPISYAYPDILVLSGFFLVSFILCLLVLQLQINHYRKLETEGKGEEHD